jgi:hypothetical protein
MNYRYYVNNVSLRTVQGLDHRYLAQRGQKLCPVLADKPKRLVRPGLGFGSFRTARRTLAGYEAMAMMRKGQVGKIGGCDMKAQAALVAEMFRIAA